MTDDRSLRARAELRSTARHVRIMLAQLRLALSSHESAAARVPAHARPVLPLEDADALALARYIRSCEPHIRSGVDA